jgi:hypothetical protein
VRPFVFCICSMTRTAIRADDTAPAPQGFRDALAALVQIGLRVAEMVGQTADAETELAKAAAQGRVAEGVSPLASSLAEAIEADKASAAAAEARHTVVARTEAVAAAFARVSRAIRLTVAQAERLDRGWARGGVRDDRQAMAKRQIARAVGDAIAREAEGERAVTLNEALTERLEALDTEAEFGDRPVEEVIAIICRDLGLDPVRTTVRSPIPGAISAADASKAAPLTGGAQHWAVRPVPRPPDG